jgi:YVTN family beta-propeller protein
MQRLKYVMSVAGVLGLVLTLALAPWGGALALGQTVVATVPVGSSPFGVGVNPTTNRIYVSNFGSNTASVIDGATDAVVATVPVGSSPLGVGVNPATNRIYVANFGSNTISVIDGATNTVAATVPVSGGLNPSTKGVGVNPTTNRIYVAGASSFDTNPNLLVGMVSVIDGATNAVTATVP